jgi:hypothetical protein
MTMARNENEQQRYAEQVAIMRSERAERERNERMRAIEEEYSQTIEARDQQDDRSLWDTYDSDAEFLEREYARLESQGKPPPPQFSDVEVDYLRQHSAQDLARAHWSGIRDSTGKVMTNADVLISGSGYAQKKLNTDRNSPTYREALEILGPAEKTGLPTADEILKTINTTSKYGRDLTAKQYNRAAKELQQRKSKGDYQD